jgi:hypothetical protein
MTLKDVLLETQQLQIFGIVAQDLLYKIEIGSFVCDVPVWAGFKKCLVSLDASGKN